MASGIYKITNLVNWKVYIGSAIDIRERWWQHTGTLNNKIHHNKHLESSWIKYGAPNFRFDVLEYVVADKSLLEKHEHFWIELLNATDRKYGYNKRIGTASNRGFKHSKESIERIRESNLGQKRSEELKKKLKDRIITPEWRKNMSEGAKGKKHTEQAKVKVSEALRKRIRSSETYDKIAAKTRGQKRSLEQRKRMSEGRWLAKNIIINKVMARNEKGEWV